MRAKVARICSVLALLAGVTMLGGDDFECGFDTDDGVFDKSPVVQTK